MAQGAIRQPAIGHLQAQGQAITAQIHRRAGPIQQPAPARTAVLLAGPIASYGNGARAADHHDAGGLVAHGPAQGGALIACDVHPIEGQLEGRGSDLAALALHRALQLDATGSDAGRHE